MPQSSDIGKNSDGDISDFWITGQSLINENCHNNRTSNDVDIKLVSISKLDNRNTERQKKDNDVTSANWDVIVFFLFMANFEQSRSWITATWSIKLTFSILVDLSCYKNWKPNLKISNTAFMLLLSVKVLSLIKNEDFLQKNAGISKIKWVLVLKGIFSKTRFVSVFPYQILSF